MPPLQQEEKTVAGSGSCSISWVGGFGGFNFFEVHQGTCDLGVLVGG